MKQTFHKIKAVLSHIDKPSLFITCAGMILALGIASYGNALKARLDTKPVDITTVRAVITPSVKPTPTVTPSATPVPTPTPTPTSKKVATKPVITYVTQTAPQSSVSSLHPHTSAPAATPTPSTAPASGSSAPATAAVSYTSSNWSGYLSTGSTYTSVSGSWTVPSPTGNGTSTSADAAWVGIGGVTSDDLIQAGTIDTVSASGQVTINAFYEILPAAAQLVTMTVSPGDVMSTSVVETGTNLWQITITDQTTGRSFVRNVSYTSTLSSAEWIEEDPSSSDGQQLPFDHFGSVSFTSGSTVANGSSATIAGIGAQSITMLGSSNTPIAIPSAVSGGSFSVTRSGA